MTENSTSSLYIQQSLMPGYGFQTAMGLPFVPEVPDNPEQLLHCRGGANPCQCDFDGSGVVGNLDLLFLGEDSGRGFWERILGEDFGRADCE